MSRKTYNTMFKCKNTTLPLFVDFYSTNRFWVVCIGRQTAMYTEYCFLDNSGYNRKWKNMFQNSHMISLNYKSNFCFSTVIFVINHVPAGRQLNTSTNLFHKRVLYFLLHSSQKPYTLKYKILYRVKYTYIRDIIWFEILQKTCSDD